MPKRVVKVLNVGTDSELFVRLASTNTLIPVIGRVGGTKIQPIPVLGGNGFAVQEDNVMLEFNVPPSSTAGAFVSNINKMLEFLEKDLKEKGLKYSIAASARFRKSQLDHPQAMEIGCEPDYCVYTRSKNPRPDTEGLTLRSCGGHVHVSYTIDDKPLQDVLDREPMVKAMDFTLGLPSVLLDKDTNRKKLYGRAGSFRPKEYGEVGGLEYRVLSNFWLKSDSLKKFVFDSTLYAAGMVTDSSDFLDSYSHRFQQAIDSQDRGLAEIMLSRYAPKVYEETMKIASELAKEAA
jgi:hypothetical protein